MNITPSLINEYMQFRQNFNGDARSRIQQMLNSGQISQAQFDNAVQMARQLEQMLPPSAHR